MLKKFVFHLILATLLVALTLVLSETAIRVLYPLPWCGYDYLPPQQHLFQYDSEIGWIGRKNASGVFASLDFEETVRHDDNGFRNSNVFYVTKKKNILILGDSFGWGWGVADDEMVSRSMMDQNSDVNAYNLSAPGYGTDQEYLILRRFFNAHPSYRPDAVIVLFYVNDFNDIVLTECSGYPKSYFELSPKGDLVLMGIPVPNDRPQVYVGERKLQKRPSSFWRFSHLYNLLKFYLQNKRLPHVEPPPPSPFPWSVQEQQQVNLALRLLEEIRNSAESRGADLLVVTVFPDNDRRVDALGRALDKKKIAHDTFERAVIPLNELWNDHHMNARGHRNLAEKILNRLESRLDF